MPPKGRPISSHSSKPIPHGHHPHHSGYGNHHPHCPNTEITAGWNGIRRKRNGLFRPEKPNGKNCRKISTAADSGILTELLRNLESRI